MSLQTIARRYAVALADVVIERGEAHSVQEELLNWGSMVQSNPLLQESFSNPTIPYEQKRNVLKEIIARTRVCRTTANFLQVLLSNQRVNELVDVNRKFAEVLDERVRIRVERRGKITKVVLAVRPYLIVCRLGLRAGFVVCLEAVDHILDAMHRPHALQQLRNLIREHRAFEIHEAARLRDYRDRMRMAHHAPDGRPHAIHEHGLIGLAAVRQTANHGRDAL